MRIVDLAVFDDLNETERLDAISLVGDAIDGHGISPFGIVVSDKLFHAAADRSGALSVRFASMLPIETASLEKTLVEIPANPAIWDQASREWRQWQLSMEGIDGSGIDAPILETQSLRGRHLPSEKIYTLPGSYGFAVLMREGFGWGLSYVPYLSLQLDHRQRRLGRIPDERPVTLLEWSQSRIDDQTADVLLRAYEASHYASSSTIIDEGDTYSLVLKCVDRARLQSLHHPDAEAAHAAAQKLVLNRRL